MSLFRKDINGLRAIAVIAVVFYHFNPTWLPGGFAGVDVFFVISGFLMTSIIFRGIESKHFSILNFYASRANRIIPALATLCFFLIVLGWFFLPPYDYNSLADHASSSVAFFSNITYWRESGYFDEASYEKWLLHTWSLSVEWQFYIIYPVALLALSKVFSIKNMKLILMFSCLLGFLFSVFATQRWPEAAYYLLPTRAWEMLIGGIAFLYPITIKRKWILELLGLSLIVLSYILFSQEDLWPGYLSFLPVFGTFLVIQSNNNSVLTGNRLFQKIGSWSYSIYLWHWPFVVSIYYFSLNEAFVYLGLFFSVLFGFISFTYIEKIKFNNYLSSVRDFFTFKPFYISLVVGLSAYIISSNGGVLSRFSEVANLAKLEANRADAEAFYRANLMTAFSNQGESILSAYLCTLDGGEQTITSIKNCLNAKLKNKGYLIVGDSHARDALHALNKAYPHENFGLLHQSGCAPTQYKGCFLLLDLLKDSYIKDNEQVQGIIFASLFKDKNATNKFIQELKSYPDKPVLIIGAGLRLKKTVVEESIKAKVVTNSYNLLGSVNDVVAPINNKLSSIQGVHYFDKYGVFCDGDYCQVNKDLEPYVWDSDHLSQLGIDRLASGLEGLSFFNKN